MDRLPYPVALQFFAEEKTEPATPRKKEEARKKGQVAKSPEVSQAFVLLAGTLALAAVGGRIVAAFEAAFYRAASFGPEAATPGGIGTAFVQAVRDVMPWLGLFFGAVFAAAFFGQYVQVGSLMAVEPILPQLSRIDPIQGLRRLFGLRALVELGKALLKAAFLAAVLYGVLKNELARLPALAAMAPAGVAAAVGDLSLRLLFAAALASAVVAALDFGYQRFDYARKLRMTKQELKDEWKKTEGDPLTKSRLRRRRRELATRRMMQEVPKADVVITNPTHLSVALRYDALRDPAPRVVAKGADFLALRIREVARRHGVEVVENPPLARALYRDVPLGGRIPPAFYRAVAEVLAFVYRKKGRTLGGPER
ncbi:flagellar biosynthesis protein FlhB [Hydrogenibacillus schlegelii]|uniref:Flagellar biosynthetic protein FlhB n=1 Tax=Hydrogenibacillus schlegelii TaxID=1484 RepID=A0A132NDK9_HYDSH|nr:flagellar biosynthesis protein FlhB [Hydrogenibacillus schlegelii]KWX08056.1 hypothetical protein TR75_01435 [Hydrogenibacillus schlegelii]OAR04714.1 hypothetical protein SA87_09345 [Hydrogenibacillus schlegelii]PTQ54960.1 MAG: Flagellar biosynthesis protein FlhB [Hydrogenibacillus schlegelii]